MASIFLFRFSIVNKGGLFFFLSFFRFIFHFTYLLICFLFLFYFVYFVYLLI